MAFPTLMEVYFNSLCEAMMKTIFLPVMLVALMSGDRVLAHDNWENGGRWERNHRGHERYEARAGYYQPRIYFVPPPPVYREQRYYRPASVYYADERQYYQQRPVYSYQRNRLPGQVLGAVAGAAIGSQFGHGDERVAGAVIGAVVGSAFGRSLSD